MIKTPRIPLLLIAFVFFILDTHAQNAGGQMLGSDHKVMIIPFNMNNYFSDADMDIAKANKKQQQEISNLFRYGLNYNVNARVITAYDTYSILTDTTIQSAKDLKMIYQAISYQYDTPMDIITPDTAKLEKKKLFGLDKLMNNGDDDKNLQEDQAQVKELKEEKYMNALVTADMTATLAPVSHRFPIESAELLMQATGAQFQRGGEQAYYHIGGDYIRIPEQNSFFEPINFYRTALHELTHNAKRLFMPRRTLAA